MIAIIMISMKIFISASWQSMGVKPCAEFSIRMFLSRGCKASVLRLSVTLQDEGLVDLWDFSSNFIFTEKDIGKNRAVVSVDKLQELNYAVSVSAQSTKLTIDQLSGFQAVVFNDIGLENAVEFNNYCHNHQPPIAFIKAEVRGLFASVFCDFGPAFTVSDVDGEDPCTGIIASINNGNPAEVYCTEDERLEFKDEDMVVFSEVKGMTELNDGKPRRIKESMPYSFTLEEDTTNFSAHVGGGIVTKVKQPIVLNFKPLKDAIIDPGDFSKFDRPPLLHLAFQALDQFVAEQGCLPMSGSEKDAQKLISIVRNLNENLVGDRKVEDINPKLLQQFAFGARAVLNPMAAIFGGIVGQEVIKACSGKFHPIFQFFYFDSVEALPTEPLEAGDFTPLSSRYDAQISVFGSNLQKKLEDAKVFVVGSGALGCEFLKNLALMGVSCGKKGKLTITDDDVIEKNNLSSHFLFREGDIGLSKTTLAASSTVESINPQLIIEALQIRVGQETENVFDDAFWEKLDVVINALDNVDAKLYVDKRCLYFKKPFLESGTLGTQCTTHMVIPHLTENYGAFRDPPENQAPTSPLTHYPYKIDHCLTWARSQFQVLLEDGIDDVNGCLSNASEYTSSLRKRGDALAIRTLKHVLEFLNKILNKERCESFQDCIEWARLRFEEYFANRIKEINFHFPEDALASQADGSFWSAPKRFPHPLQFSDADPTHLHFIMAASILRAETFGIAVPDWVASGDSMKLLAQEVNMVMVPEFIPGKVEKKSSTTSQSSAAYADDVAYIDSLLRKLKQCQEELPTGFRMKPIQFHKDDEKHIDLISALTNMRARNYSIPEVDKLKAWLIVGKIRPTIATSTAMATGFVCLELYKVLDGGHKVEDYRNANTNLAAPSFNMCEAVAAKVTKYREMSWTVWDRWVIKDNPTMNQVVMWLAEKGLKVYNISCGKWLLYNCMTKVHEGRKDKTVLVIAKEAGNSEIAAYHSRIEVKISCFDDKGETIRIPPVSIYFR